MPSMDANTNKVYRKKYFMDADKVVFAEEDTKIHIVDEHNPLIEAESVLDELDAVPINQGEQKRANAIRVQALKDGERVTVLKIDCPCGRHTEINVQYAANEGMRR